MAFIRATDTPFLQSKAQAFVVPLPASGQILHPVLLRIKGLFPAYHQTYQRLAMSGELSLGQVLFEKVNTQHTGLMAAQSGTEYVAGLINAEFLHHHISERVLMMCLETLKPLVYDKMRYQGLRRLAVFTTPMIGSARGTDDKALSAQNIMVMIEQVFGQMSKISIDVHMDKANFASLIKST